MKILTAADVFAVVALEVAALAVALLSGSSSDGQVARLGGQLAQEQQHDAQLSRELSGLSSQVSGLTVPSGPLSAYNEVCQTTATSDTTGVTSDW
jgi:hypothetical protein